MRIAIMQPTYLPWLGYMAMIDAADTFVLLDTVPISRQSWQTRNKVRLRDGRVVWLSIPTKHDYQQPLNEVEIDYGRDWQKKHWATITMCYPRSSIPERLAAAYWGWRPASLTALTQYLISKVAQDLGITTTIVQASELETANDKTERLATILHQLDATSYLASRGSTYLEGQTHVGNVPIEWFDYQHPTYQQGDLPFMSHLSIVDCIAHCPNPLTVLRTGYAAKK